MTQDESAKTKAQKHNSKLMLVRYGKMGLLGWFEHNEPQIPKNKQYVIVKTDRGLELGQLVGPYNYKAGNYRFTPEQVEAYYTQGNKDISITTGGRFVRFATHEDIREQEHLEASAIEEAKCCQRFADELGLNMKIIEAEHLFGGERILFYFTSDGRVDFRELVKKLAREYQTRIELRQIGSRDEARLVSDYESCGLECCCKRFLKILDPVNMRMAKLQKATLDPSKISGHCGRLKCCLRYEDYTYRELKSKLPPRNTQVQTPKGVGIVVDFQVLTQLVVVQTPDGEKQAWPLEEIQILSDKPAATPPAESSASEEPEASASPQEQEEVSFSDENSVQSETVEPAIPEALAEEVAEEIEEVIDQIEEAPYEDSTDEPEEPKSSDSEENNNKSESPAAAQVQPGQDKPFPRKKRRKNRRRRNRNNRNLSGREGNPSPDSNNPSNGNSAV
ncbi:MAG TPA: regulatory iron-sulfur-containing complex subunit RicT [Anaerohalosphaeraceae bacterium]|nr:regulatory iron-sulfur-containing complex subunit RicT [Anaerohalosphaeraceae bacterium]